MNETNATRRTKVSAFDQLLEASQTTDINDVQKAIEESETGRYDDGFWKPTQDDAGNASAIIRFLPNPVKGEAHWTLLYKHWFKGPTGKIYDEWCRTTIGENDPVQEHVRPLWNSGFDADKDVARARGRKKNYIANILVIKDNGKPENNGKVFQYRFGPKIFDKIKGALTPEFEGDSPINPFDLLDGGADFRVRVRKVAGWTNYDESGFGNASALFGGDRARMGEVFAGVDIPSLSQYKDPANYKSYDELKKRMNEVLSEEGEETRAEDDAKAHTSSAPPADKAPERESEKPAEKKRESDNPTNIESGGGEDDDDLAFFQKLQNEG